MPNLASYIQANGVSRKQLAETLGVDRTTLWRLAAGKTRPSLDTMLAVQKATNGAVDLNSWASIGQTVDAASLSSDGQQSARVKGRAA